MLKRFLIIAFFCILGGRSLAQGADQEANLKAVFIYNFTKYIDWEKLPADGDFDIGVIGSSPIINSLNEIARTSRVNNRQIVVHHYEKPEEIQNCQILFIPNKSPFSLGSILDKANKGILTISEEPGFAKMGTAFNFIVVKDKLRFEANLKALEAAGLRAGSQLLKLAIIVD